MHGGPCPPLESRPEVPGHLPTRVLWGTLGNTSLMLFCLERNRILMKTSWSQAGKGRALLSRSETPPRALCTGGSVTRECHCTWLPGGTSHACVCSLVRARSCPRSPWPQGGERVSQGALGPGPRPDPPHKSPALVWARRLLCRKPRPSLTTAGAAWAPGGWGGSCSSGQVAAVIDSSVLLGRWAGLPGFLLARALH